ncbi:MAG: glycosyl transferase-like protein [Candidatus Nomurabacteria bacterium]|nr:glycosyl transferase-like protein [Candidatus Nomurabacteria bacterium]
MKKISICIPTYEMKGKGHVFLEQSFGIFAEQTYQDFDIVISDHSQDTAIEDLCKTYADKLDIYYYRNTENRGNSSANINNAIKKATGQLIKVLFQDDFLFHEKALAEIANCFDVEKDHWLVSGCTHTTDGTTFFKPFYPRPDTIHSIWIKTVYSSPSTLTIKNDSPLLFDESLIWLMDSDYYRRCYDKFGEPKILHTINVVNRVGDHQVTNTVASRALQKREYTMMLERYERGLNFWYYRTVGCLKDFIKHMLGKI